MSLANWFRDTPAAEAPRPSGPVRVGWLLQEERTGVIYYPPERFRSADVNKTHAKSASRCPAVLNLESRYFVIRCPFDLHLRFARTKEGKAGVRNMLGEASPVRPAKLNQIIHVTNEIEWRYPDRPTIQVSLPYLFIADEPVYMSQLSAFMHYRRESMPGTIFGGRFPIHLWPRPLMWAFEWHEPERDIVLRRGEPWFYVCFETEPQDRPVQVIAAEMTEDLRSFSEHISGAVNYVNQTFSLFKAAERRRPEKLLVPKGKG
ncbi:MAG: hypothetical protein D6754_06080 [Alphaproteobacteria bacterium]|nr:MAG: hypothetical protein D6754_06080 [Alphaproteobacteria bacterium]